MLTIDRELLQDYLRSRLEDDKLELPTGVTIEELTDQFSAYLEIDLYDWLRGELSVVLAGAELVLYDSAL